MRPLLGLPLAGILITASACNRADGTAVEDGVAGAAGQSQADRDAAPSQGSGPDASLTQRDGGCHAAACEGAGDERRDSGGPVPAAPEEDSGGARGRGDAGPSSARLDGGRPVDGGLPPRGIPDGGPDQDASAASRGPDRAVHGTLDESDLWQVSIETDAAALLSVHGQSAQDVWVVGADDGRGPMVLRLLGRRWERVNAGVSGVDLWWVNTLPGGTAFLGGDRATVLRFRNGLMEPLDAPGGASEQVWGVWARGANEAYVVGASSGSGGFIWHFLDDEWTVISLPELPRLPDAERPPGLFKVWGRILGDGSVDVWVVGGAGTVLRGNADSGFELLESGVDEQLVGLGGDAETVWTLGGDSTGVALQWSTDGIGALVTPLGAPLLQGLALDGTGGGWVVGLSATTYRYSAGIWSLVDTGLDVWPETLHSAWGDPTGGVWAVGGDVFTRLDRGVLVHRGTPLPPYIP